MARRVKATCMLCEAVCGLSVELDGNAVTSIRGDPDDPFSRGHLCPKAAAIGDIQSDPDRLRWPLRRNGESFEPISWTAALDEAARKIADVQRRHGRNAVAVYLGNPTVHSHGALLAVTFFLRALGTRSRFSATSVDQLPHMLASLELFGHQLLLPVPDVDRTRFMLVLGANPLVSNGSLMTAPGIHARLKALRARGGKLAVVDPRRTETAAFADQHLFVRPGSDALLLLALLHTIFAESLERPGRLTDAIDGLDALRALALRFPPERVAAHVGQSPDAIRTLARDFATTHPAVCYGRVGTSTQAFGGLATWLITALNVVTGNLDEVGGAMFPTPAADIVPLMARLGEKGHFGKFRSRVRGLPEFGGELPVATLAEEMETPGDGQIRALVTFAGNPVLSTPNGARLEKALKGLEVMVSIDLYRNETTRHAHYLLPTHFGFERDHFDLAFYNLAVRNVAKWVPAQVAPPAGTREDFDVLLSLASRVVAHGGGRGGGKQRAMLEGLRALGSRRMVDLLLRMGPHRLSLKKLLAHPEGVDLGPLEPVLPARLYTKDRRIHLAPTRFLDDIPRLEKELDAAPPALVAIGRRQLRSNNSWMHNSARLVKGPVACTLLMHPEDASARGLRDGETVRVRSRVGEVEVVVRLSDEVGRGVVSLPHGWGHSDGRTGQRIAQAHAGASLNDLTDELRIDALSGNAALSGVPVEVERVG